MKRLISIIIILALICVGIFAARSIEHESVDAGRVPVLPAGSELNIIFATDLHHLSPDLIGEDVPFVEYMEGADGKMTHYSREIVSAFIEEVTEKSPDLLLLGGDLSFNGEKASHIELKALLTEVRNANIPVLVIPGNHDINRPNASRFVGETTEKTAIITPNGFWELYSPLGANHAISRDKNSLSYLYELAEDFYILMIDTSRYKNGVYEDGRIEAKTLKWMEECLKKAQTANARLMMVTHHNLLPHNPLFLSNYTIADYQNVTNLLETYGVSLNLSGHMHVQHIARPDQPDGIYDIATGSLCVYPNYYGQIQISPERGIYYQTKRVDVSSWTDRQGLSDPNLLEFEQYALEFMNKCTSFKLEQRLSADVTDEKLRTELIRYVSRLNAAYFAGQVIGVDETNEEFLRLIEELGVNTDGDIGENIAEEFFGGYMRSILNNNPDSDSTTLTID